MTKTDVVDLENTTLKTLKNMEVKNRVESPREKEKKGLEKRKNQH